MREVFSRAVLLAAYCASVIAPTTSAIYKVKVLDFKWSNLFKIIPFNTEYVSVDELWNNIYQIPYIAQRLSVPSNPKYIHLTIVTPGRPYIKIDNETLAPPNNSVYVANSVVLLSVVPPESNILCITKDESPGESGKSTSHFKWKVLPKSKTSVETSVTGKKSIVLDFIRSSTAKDTPNYIWGAADWSIVGSRNDLSEDLSVWHNVQRIRVKAYDHNGKMTTDRILLKDSKQRTQKQLNTENGVIYVDFEYGSRPDSESGVKHIVPLWMSSTAVDEVGKDKFMGIFRFMENPTNSSIWQKMKGYLNHSNFYRDHRLVDVHIEMIGIENLVITDHDQNDTTSPVDFEKAIAVIFTASEERRTFIGNRLADVLKIKISGFSKNQVAKLPIPQEIPSGECSICLGEFKEKGVTQLQCKHFFHRECVQTWLLKNTNCPLCRADLTHWDFTLPAK